MKILAAIIIQRHFLWPWLVVEFVVDNSMAHPTPRGTLLIKME